MTGPDTPRIDLHVLGPIEVRAPARTAADGLQAHPKTLAVLVYIVLEGMGRSVSRDRIASVFWPEADAQHARGALRQTLRSLRNRAGNGTICSHGRQAVRVDPAYISCDAFEFDAHLEDGHTAGALGLYRGDFLDGFHVNGSHGWDEWVEVRRLRYRSRASNGAWTLSGSAEAEGDLQRAAYWAKWALGLAPHNELEVRRLMRTLDRIGDRAGALRAYRGLVTWLDTELGVPPAPETQQLERAIRARTENGASTVVPRRQGPDRRTGHERRRGSGAPPVDERRSGRDRRMTSERRTGRDRRADS